MAWNDQQIGTILDEYFENGNCNCPDCGTELSARILTVAEDYALDAHCPRGCGALIANHGNDPKASQFRPWTKDEIKQLAEDRYYGNPEIRCPVDGTRIDVRETTGSGFRAYYLQCPRCRANGQHSF
ncbi:MAG TPA: hypothetical protein VJ783_30595 [Pirellulales bacterium]|nr:hypothetical protein [Pirellulales bacterium]